MRVRIVCYEDVNSWILGKFALKMNEELARLGVQSEIARVPDPSADVNHHIIYLDYDGRKYGLDTIMITHVDAINKLNMIKRQLETAAMAVCMSGHTVESLAKAGVDRRKLCFINPAHDEVMTPRKVVLGITSKIHDDGRKREGILTSLAAHLRHEDFMFKIMGKGWESQVAGLRGFGFEVQHSPEFVREEYIRLMPTLDYYLYMSHDEGSMGFVDALAAGVRTIVTPQGYHLDAPGGITHSIDGFEDLVKALQGISAERRRLTESVQDWTWRNYTLKHLEIWERLAGVSAPPGRAKAPGLDGLSSMLAPGETYTASKEGRMAYRLSLYRNYVLFGYRNWKRKARKLMAFVFKGQAIERVKRP